MTSVLHEVQRSGQTITTHETPATIEEALALLQRYGPRARPIAGGTDLLIELDRGVRPGTDVLIDLGRIPGLNVIAADDFGIELGALVTHNQVVASELCRTTALPLTQACLEVGSPQLRNRATIAGNLMTASPANDTISALLALDATVTLTSTRGVRSLPIAKFLTGFRTTDLAPDELLTAIHVPHLQPDQRGIFVKAGLRRAQAISVVHLAAVVTITDDLVSDARFAIGSVAPTVLLLPEVRSALLGRQLDDAATDAAATIVAASVSPIDDLRATASYRSELVSTMTRRALRALGRNEQMATWPTDPPLLWGRGFDGRFPTGAGLAGTITDDRLINSTVNGVQVSGDAAASSNLLDWLRDHADTTGVKEGCAEGECGACTVDLDGAAVMACLVPAGRAQHAEIVTVEGLATDDELHPVQTAFMACSAVQCGFCTPGFVVASAKLLEEQPSPTREQVSAGLAGNLCRCTGYNAIHQAVQLAAGTS